VCIVVPNGTHRPEPLAAAIARHHPTWRATAVWSGDPQLRPGPETEVTWSPDDAPDERALAGAPPAAAEWGAASRATRRLLAAGAPEVVLLWAGSVAVLGDLTPLVATPGAAVVVARATSSLGGDELLPGELDVALSGAFSTTVAVVRPAAAGALDDLHRCLAAHPEVGAGRWIERFAQLAGASVCADPRIGAGAWRWDADDPALLDLPSFDPERPWALDAGIDGAGRVAVVGHPAREAALRRAQEQLAGERRPLAAPGGLVLDEVVQGLVRSAQVAPPRPWSESAAFRAWLEPRYWSALHAHRRDLAAAFPDPAVRDADAFRTWCRRAWVDDGRSPLLGVPATGRAPIPVAPALRGDGVNLVGYLTRAASLGDVARRIEQALAGAGVPVSTIAYQRTASPELVPAHPVDQRIEHEATLAVVTADQFPLLVADHPELRRSSRRTVGYWFWELEHVPAHMRAACALVDEIWTGSTFVRDAFAAVTRIPVRHVPVPVPEPWPSARARDSFAALADAADRFVFLVVFDHLSVTERKNPVGAIEAFRRAFRDGEGPLLVVKAMNGGIRWSQHQRVLAAAGGRSDVRVWDEHLERDDLMALVGSADCLVSLHRSEGLGLHLAEAMWLGTPVLATRYSGNLDLMDDTCALLVDWTPVHVRDGQGVYPRFATWADPDLDQAAASMRRLAGDPGLGELLAAAGRARMERQPSLAETGRRMAALLHEGAPGAPVSEEG